MRCSSLRGCALIPIAFALWLTGCSTSPMSRIDANRALYESWPVDMQSAVLDGKAVKGMTPDVGGEPVAFWRQPAFWAAVSLVMVIALNAYFW